MNKKALIIGISGQDGAYLSKELLDKDYEVYGTSRDAEVSNFAGLHKLDIFAKVKLLSMSLIDFRSVLQVISTTNPDEIYNLAGQSSVGLSYFQPVETIESISIGTLNILEVLRFTKMPAKFYNACSSECFGETNGTPANELTPFNPKSPYAIAKSTAFWLVSNYREAYNIFACSGILFNHESPMRPKRFVTKKIISAACDIAKKKADYLKIGRIDIKRDWGWAPEYVNAMYSMLQLEKPDDFVIASGVSISLEEFISTAFNFFSLDFRDYVKVENSLIRPTDISESRGNPLKANDKLGWRAKYNYKDVIRMMIEYELDRKG